MFAITALLREYPALGEGGEGWGEERDVLYGKYGAGEGDVRRGVWEGRGVEKRKDSER